MLKKYLALFVLIFTPHAVLAADFNQGLADFNKGDYQQAYKTWLEVVNGNNTSKLSNSLEWHVVSKSEQANAQYGIGLLYWLGKGVNQDYKQAEQWLRKSAEADNKEAALKLGVLYLENLADNKDDVQAKAWFLKAANAGQPDAQFNLGILLSQGVGGKKNLKQAKYWFTQAANQGDLAAKNQLLLLSESKKHPVSHFLTPATVIANSGVNPVTEVATPSSAKTAATPETEKNSVAVIATNESVKTADDTADSETEKNTAAVVSANENLKTPVEITNSASEKNSTVLPPVATVAKANDNALPPATKNEGDYLIQVITSSNRANTLDLTKRYPGSNWQQTYEQAIKGKKVHVLRKCCFETQQLADQAIQDLLAGLQTLKPFTTPANLAAKTQPGPLAVVAKNTVSVSPAPATAVTEKLKTTPEIVNPNTEEKAVEPLPVTVKEKPAPEPVTPKVEEKATQPLLASIKESSTAAAPKIEEKTTEQPVLANVTESSTPATETDAETTSPKVPLNVVTPPTTETTKENKGDYSIQVVALDDNPSAVKLTQQYPATNWQIYEKEIRGRKFYILGKCCFDTQQLAQQVIRELPASLRRLRPFVIKGRHNQN